MRTSTLENNLVPPFYRTAVTLTLRSPEAPHLVAQTVARVQKYASLLLRANLGHFETARSYDQSAVKSHNGPADRLQSVGGACR